jgi:hypothetical protein
MCLESGTNPTGFEYTAVLELNKWGHFVLVEKRDRADLLMHLASSDGGTSVPKGYTLISLLDPENGSVLWSDLQTLFHSTGREQFHNGFDLSGIGATPWAMVRKFVLRIRARLSLCAPG